MNESLYRPSKEMSDPTIDDYDRTGDDLVARIDELSRGCGVYDETKNGWRPLLAACKREIKKQQEKIRWLDKFKCWMRALLDKQTSVEQFRRATDEIIGR